MFELLILEQAKFADIRGRKKMFSFALWIEEEGSNEEEKEP